MMKILITLIIVHFLLSGCSTIATGGAEITGLSLMHDRRSAEQLVIDERIEINASVELNSHDETRKFSHFNITSYNGIVLVTGEAPTEALRDQIITIVRVIPNVKLVHNEIRIAKLSSFSTRSHDTLLTTKVKTSLSKVKHLPGFDATRVKVVTESGVVYLLGLVHAKEGHIASEIARREKGVKKVVKIFEYIE